MKHNPITIDSDHRFRKLFENSFSGVTLLNKNLQTIYRGSSSEKIIGWNEPTPQHQTMNVLIHEEDRARVGQVLKRVLDNPNVPYACTFRLLHYAGHYILLQCTFTNMLEEHDVEAIVCNFVDVTGHKIGREKVAVSELFIKTITDNLPVMIAYWTPDLRCLFANKPYMDWFEKTPEEIIGISKQDLMPNDEFNLYKVYFDRVLKGKPQSHERTFIKKNGTITHTHTQYLPDIHGDFVKGFYTLIYDTTEIKIAETEISLRNEQNKDFLDNMVEGFVFLDENQCYTYANKASEKMSGMSIDALIGKNIWKVFPEAVGSSIHRAILKAYKEKSPGSTQEHLVSPDQWIETRIYPAGKGISIFFRDITKTKNEQQHLKLLESVITNTKDAVIITESMPANAHGPRILYVNEAFTRMTGYTAEDMIGKTPRILQGPKSDQSELKRLSEALRKMEACEITTINYKKNGEEFWMNLSVSPVFNVDNICTHFIAIERDVTESKKSEQEIKKLNERFLLISKATNDALFEYNFETGELWWSESHYTLFGFDPEQPQPNREAWLNKIHPDSQQFIRNLMGDIQQQKSTNWSNEISYYKSDHTIGTLLSRGFVMRNEQQHAVRVLGSYVDITKQKNEEVLKNFLADISLTFIEPLELNITLDRVLHQLVGFGNFSIAETWLISQDKKKINLVSHSSNTEDMKTFYNENLKFKSLMKSEGLPGKAWETKRIQLWTNVYDDTNFLRKETARKIGLKTVYGIPLIHNDEVFGVLVLGLNKVEKPKIVYTELFDSLSKILGAEIERKQLEWELNGIFKFAPDVICIFSADGYFNKINPAMSALLEYSADELLTISILEFVHPDDVEITASEFQRLKDGDSVFYFENRYITKTGKIKWLSWTATPANEEGLMFGVAKDITEKKDLEELLNKANKLAQIGGWEIDLIKSTVFWSDITKEIHEVSSDFEPDFESAITRYKQGEDRALITAKMQETFHNGTPYDIEVQMVTLAGNIKWVRIIGEGEFAGDKCIRVYGSFQDIDLRKKAELAAKSSLEEKNVILESIGDAFIAVNNDWVITYWNNTAEKLMNVSKIHAVDQILWGVYKDFVNPKAYRQYYKALKTGQMVHFENYYKDLGKWHEISAYPSVNGLSIFCKDITERKNAEIELKKLNKTLKEQTRELSISNAELEQFAYVASHDLQEPLRMVTSFLTLIENKYNPILDDKGKKYIHFAVDGAKRMRHIILDLLEFSRVGNSDNNIENVNLNNLVTDIISLHRKQMEEKQAIITYVDLPTLNTYHTPMRQIFQNLISNALKYCHPDVKPVIDITCKESLTDWHFAVKDNGIGIDKQYFQKIFIIFQRLHNKDEYFGTGMGLALTKKIIENLGGKIWVESNGNQGSIFHFTINKENEFARGNLNLLQSLIL